MEKLFHSIDLNHVAVLLIDMQDRYLDNREKWDLIPNQVAVLAYCEEKGIPVIMIETEGFGTTNFRLIEAFDRIPDHKKAILVKPREDAFDGTDLDEVLKSFGTTTFLLIGVNACKCVYKTAKTGRKNGYTILISAALIAGNCDKYDHFNQQNNLSRRRDCPDCRKRTSWYYNSDAGENIYSPITAWHRYPVTSEEK